MGGDHGKLWWPGSEVAGERLGGWWPQGSSFPGSLDSILGWSLGQEASRPCLDRSVVQREGKSQASHCPSCLGLSPLHPESVMTRRPSAFPPLGDVVIKGQGRLGAGGHCLCYNPKCKWAALDRRSHHAGHVIGAWQALGDGLIASFLNTCTECVCMPDPLVWAQCMPCISVCHQDTWQGR